MTCSQFTGKSNVVDCLRRGASWRLPPSVYTVGRRCRAAGSWRDIGTVRKRKRSLPSRSRRRGTAALPLSGAVSCAPAGGLGTTATCGFLLAETVFRVIRGELLLVVAGKCLAALTASSWPGARQRGKKVANRFPGGKIHNIVIGRLRWEAQGRCSIICHVTAVLHQSGQPDCLPDNLPVPVDAARGLRQNTPQSQRSSRLFQCARR